MKNDQNHNSVLYVFKTTLLYRDKSHVKKAGGKMVEYQLRKRNLPYQVLVLKGIGREVLSSKNYSELLKYRLSVRQLKNAEFRAGDNCSGSCNWWNKILILRPSDTGNLLTDRVIFVWLHEMSHFVWHRDRRKANSRTKIHAKAFRGIMKRLESNYEQDVKPRLPEMIAGCQQREAVRREEFKQADTTRADIKAKKNSIEYKLNHTQLLVKRWETKRKRAETALKKLGRKQKLYNTLLKKG